MKAEMVCYLEEDVVYRYFDEAQYAESMVKSGVVKINTLDWLRQIEMGAERRDQEEGLNVREAVGNFRLNQMEHIPLVERELIERGLHGSFGIPENSRNVSFHNVLIRESEAHPNCYVYCVARRLTEEGLNLLGGAVVKIEQPFEFFKELTLCLMKKRYLTHAYIDRCHYVTKEDRLYRRVDHIRTPFKKRVDDQYQHEARAVWLTPEQDIEPVILTCPGVTEYCSVIPDPTSIQKS